MRRRVARALAPANAHALLRRASALGMDDAKQLALRFVVEHCADAMACYGGATRWPSWWSDARECGLLEELLRAHVAHIADARAAARAPAE